MMWSRKAFPRAKLVSYNALDLHATVLDYAGVDRLNS
jgi:hypothetical protein